jgi:Na+-transporting methylmalonyl-CoA/oxaloacetate decarboxylase gamma subunit
MLSKAIDLTIFGIAISFLLLTILILFIVIIKYFDNKLDNNENKKQDSNYDKVLAASVAVSLVESELEHYKSA